MPSNSTMPSTDPLPDPHTTSKPSYASWLSTILPRTILPNSRTATATAAAATTPSTPPARSILATASYTTAVATTRSAVSKIAAESRRFNQRYRDAHFDLTLDESFCLDGLLGNRESGSPTTSARVAEIYDEPVFFKDGATAGDVEQGASGDCWFLAAVATVSNVPGLLEKCCVARDETVGVYGFVFMRDGEWSGVVVDDQLYLNFTTFDDADWIMQYWFKNKEEEYNRNFARSSKALTFAKCADPNETWLPLLEKAFAKFHGDYSSLSGGFTGEGVEDLTGGVTTEVFTCDIMDRDVFWNENISKVNRDFLFGAWIVPNSGYNYDRQGVVKDHVLTPPPLPTLS